MEKKPKNLDMRLMRIMVIIIVYEYELNNVLINAKKIFEEDKFHDLFDYSKLKKENQNKIFNKQIKIISIIEKNYLLLKSMIIKYIRSDWSWERMSPLVRSILLCASVELWKLDIGIVANEYIEITKDFIPDNESYKFVNKIINEIGKEYKAFKEHKANKNFIERIDKKEK